MAEIEQLPGTVMSAETLLHRVLARKPKAVVVIEIDQEDRLEVMWSHTEVAQVAYAYFLLGESLKEVVKHGAHLYPESEESPPTQE